MKKLSAVTENIMIVIKGDWGQRDPELRTIEDLFANVNRNSCNCVEILLEISKIQQNCAYLTFGKKLKKVRTQFLTNQASEREIEEYISRNFYQNGELDFDNKASLGLLWTKLGKAGMVSVLNSFSMKIDDCNFGEFFEHVKEENPWLDNEFIMGFEIPGSYGRDNGY